MKHIDMKKRKAGSWLVILTITLLCSASADKKNYYCEYCGQKFASVSSLTSGRCQRHPDGAFKGRHKLYEGTEKEKYTCKYCGMQSNSISSLTSGRCQKHPNGYFKGRHTPAL